MIQNTQYFSFLKKEYFVSMGVLSAYVSVQRVHAYCSQKSEEEIAHTALKS